LHLVLSRLAVDEHALAISLPALCADGVTLKNLVAEIGLAYAALAQENAAGAESPEQEGPLQYADLAAWQNDLLDGEETATGREHWAAWDPAVCRILRLPQEGARAAQEGFDPQTVPVPLGASAERLTALTQAEVPPATALLAGWQVLLWRLTGQPELTLGLVCEGRSYEGLGEALGPLARHVPLVCRLDGDLSFRASLRQAHEGVEAAAEWQEFFAWERSAARHGLDLEATVFPASFEVQEWPSTRQAGGISLSLLRCEAWGDRVQVKLTVRQAEGELAADLHYDASRFARHDMDQLAQVLGNLLTAAAADPERAIADLPLAARCAPVEVHRAAAEPPLVPELFKQQAQRFPQRTAVVCGERSLTYAELAEQSFQLADRLRRRGVGSGDIVAIVLERSVETLVAILATFQAGAAYLPIEPTLPGERKSFLLEDADARIILTETKLLSALPEQRAASALCLDAGEESAAAGEPGSFDLTVLPESLAYLIYTSGSTGVPKGVAVEHRQLASYVRGIGERLALPDGAAYAMVSTFSADLGHTVLFPSLCSGGCLHVIPTEMTLDAEALADYFGRHPIDCLKIAPSHLGALMSGAARAALLPRRWLVLGGEAARREWVDELRALTPHGAVLNHYGPTETTVGVLTLAVNDRISPRLKNVPLGQPLAHTTVHLLGPDLEPVPDWFPGELVFGGAGVARGYLGRPDLTAERFLPDPAAQEPGGRVYRTGDLARRLPDGTFEFIGRADDQLKVRGYRVELGEIEAVLESHPEIRRAAVAAHDDESGGKRLAAYVASRDRALDAHALREFLRERLPDFMMPAAFVRLEVLPLTANGKIDRKALPAPEWRHLADGTGFVAPTTEAEAILAEVWAEVLRLDRVGIDDDFFQLGGDSIRGIIVRSRAEERGLTFSVQELFERPTLRGLAQIVRPAGEATSNAVEPFSLLSDADRQKLPPDLEDAYSLSRLQAGMLFHSEYGAGTAIYHNLHSFHARVRFDEEMLSAAIRQLIHRHPVLRSSFDLASFGEAVQLVHRTVDVPLRVHDLRALRPVDQEAVIAGWLQEEGLRPFDWVRPPLLAFHVHLRSEETLQFTLSFHHAILDGWSVATLLIELFQVYLALLEGTEQDGDPAPISAFRDFVALERAALESPRNRDFWQQALAGATATHLPRQGPANSEPSLAAARSLSPALPAELSHALKQAAQSVGAPIKSLLLAVHMRVLGFLCGETDLVTGLVSHGRPESADGERALGMFVNTVPFRLSLGGGSWSELARDVYARERELFPFRAFPLAELSRSRGGEQLFDTAFSFLHYHLLQGLSSLRGIEVLKTADYGESNFPLTVVFSLDPLTGLLNLRLLYRWPELDDAQVEAIGGYYLRALAAVAAAPEESYELATLISAEERRQILCHWNVGAQIEHSPDSVHERIGVQARRSPDAVAVSHEGSYLTYGTLDALTDGLAAYLRSLGVGPEKLVGVALERSLEMPVALLAVLKAGGAYVPLDTTYPAQRLSFMLADSGAEVLLTQSRPSRLLPEHSSRVVFLDPEWHKEIARTRSARPHSAASVPKGLAYVIYTSGSTGWPKGVEISYRALLNLLLSMVEEPGLTADDRLLSVTSLSFDMAELEMFLPLLVGACLDLPAAEIASDGPQLRARLVDSGATVLQATPATWRMLLQSGWRETERLRLALCGGEALLSDLAERLRPRASQLWNVYGPTETTIWSTLHRVDEVGPSTVAIGRPIINTQVYVLDRALGPVPAGTRGELYIGGDGVARGYHGRPDLTAERFVPDPYSGVPGARLYRTGDVVRFLNEGILEFLGRADQQIKIRGFRIELGEVEVALQEILGVGESVVSARQEGGEWRLVAYVVAQPGAAVTPAALRQSLRERLPAHMIPAMFMLLDRLPLTPNGKVDRRALPAPVSSRADLGIDFIAPRTPVERILADMWQELLRVDRVGVEDDFFALGGDSLIATQTVMRIRKAFGVDLQLRHIILSPTIAGVAAALLANPEQREQVERTADLMLRLAGMSEEEVERLLNEEALVSQEIQS
jgi:amino acid adenylation domain-containing protein